MTAYPLQTSSAFPLLSYYPLPRLNVTCSHRALRRLYEGNMWLAHTHTRLVCRCSGGGCWELRLKMRWMVSKWDGYAKAREGHCWNCRRLVLLPVSVFIAMLALNKTAITHACSTHLSQASPIICILNWARRRFLTWTALQSVRWLVLTTWVDAVARQSCHHTLVASLLQSRCACRRPLAFAVVRYSGRQLALFALLSQRTKARVSQNAKTIEAFCSKAYLCANWSPWGWSPVYKTRQY